MEKIRAEKNAMYGFNAATGVYEDLVKAGVIDGSNDLRDPREEGCSSWRRW